MRLFLMLAPLLLVAAAAPDHSTVAVESKAAGDNLQLVFKVIPTQGLHINMEGPWKLELKSHDGLTLAKTTYTKADMDEKLPGFVATTTAKPSKASGDVEYALTAFVCTDNVSQCYRDVHNGKASWKTAAK